MAWTYLPLASTVEYDCSISASSRWPFSEPYKIDLTMPPLWCSTLASAAACDAAFFCAASCPRYAFRRSRNAALF